MRCREDRGIEAPGQMTSHYAPGKPVRLNAAEGRRMNSITLARWGRLTLSRTGDLAEAAARLYAALLHAPQPRGDCPVP
jgi:L-threonylcarbamoyladenylate synthase